MNWTKHIAADKDRSIFFTGVTILASAAGAFFSSNEQYVLTAMSAGGAIVGLLGLLSNAIIEYTKPTVNAAIQAMTGRFKKFEGTSRHHAYHQ
jgi:hypothetical protein